MFLIVLWFYWLKCSFHSGWLSTTALQFWLHTSFNIFITYPCRTIFVYSNFFLVLYSALDLSFHLLACRHFLLDLILFFIRISIIVCTAYCVNFTFYINYVLYDGFDIYLSSCFTYLSPKTSEKKHMYLYIRMYMYTCMCRCTSTYMCILWVGVCVHVYVLVLVWVRVYVCIRVLVRVCMCMYMWMCICTCTCTCMCIYMCVWIIVLLRVCVCMYICVYLYVYAHVYI